MSPDKRHGREAARRRAAQAAAREASRRQRRRLQVIVGALVVGVVVLLGVLATIGGGDDDRQAATTTTSVEESTSTTGEVDEEAPITDDASETVSPPFEFGDGECAPDVKPEAPPETFEDAPKNCLKDDVEYKAVVGTSEGSFTIDLFPKRAPGTVNSFIQLAKWGWFDGVSFHRIVPDFVNQTGDRTGDPPGTGGPGYEIADELPPDVSSYKKWAVAMANSGPNTNGSQWFTCIDCSKLPTAGYSLFGQVSDGTEVAQAINDLGEGGDPPTIVTLEIVEIPQES